MNQTLTDINQLRNNINFASISQFFHTFQSAFRPWPVTTHDIIYARNLEANEYVFETEDLERMILDPSERIRFEDLLVRMLRLVSGKRFINASTWQNHFAKEFDKRQFEEENPFYITTTTEDTTVTTVNYFDLPLDTRIYLLHLLCEWQLDEPEKFREHLDGEDDAVQWRVDPVGFDKKGSTFWLFDDNRLYKETPKPKVTRKKKPVAKKGKRAPPPPPPTSNRRSSRRNQPAPIEETPAEQEEESEDEGDWVPWKLLCCTKLDWEQIPSKYAHSKNIDEQRFHSLLVNDLIPKIIPVMEEREKEIKKQEALMHRKRSSRIMIKELEALERASSFEPEPLSMTTRQTEGRTSNRIEKRAQEKEQRALEMAAKAREERVLERERRIAEREYRALARERRQESEDPVALVNDMIKSEEVQAPPPTNAMTIKMTVKDNNEKEVKPKRKYTKREKFDKDGNPIPRKPKLDKDGNPIPLKKRGRKPKNKSLDEENWVFDCICGVSGKNLDDGTPMIACEKCGVWQHIKCLQNSGQIDTRKNMDDVAFVCRPCENQIVDIVNDDEEQPQPKKLKMTHTEYRPPQPQQLPPQLHYPQTQLFSQTPLFPQQQQQQQPSYPSPHQFVPPPQQWPQQPPIVNRAPYYPATQPIRPPSLSSIHNLINSITPPSRGPSTPSSTIVEPPTPPAVHSQPSPSVQQVPISKLSAPVNDHKGAHSAPIVQPIAIQKPIPVTPNNIQQQPSQSTPAPFILQQTAQAPISTVRGPPPNAPPVATAPSAETVQVAAPPPTTSNNNNI